MAAQTDLGIETAYQIAKLQASVDGVFDDTLMRHWFNAAWELCAAMVGMSPYGVGHVQESVAVDHQGRVRLSGKPSGPVRLYAGGRLVAVLPPSARQFNASNQMFNPFDDNSDGTSIACSPSLCCYCDLMASYDVGHADPCGGIPPGSSRFVQAVARLFAYICENRGDVEMDGEVLTKSGAKAFLAPDLTYVM